MEHKSYCRKCGDDIATERWRLGFKMCMECGERDAKKVKHTNVPMNKSNYMFVSDMEMLKQLNPKRTT